MRSAGGFTEDLIHHTVTDTRALIVQCKEDNAVAFIKAPADDEQSEKCVILKEKVEECCARVKRVNE